MLTLRAGSERWRGVHPARDPGALWQSTRRECRLPLRDGRAPHDLYCVLLWNAKRSIFPCTHHRFRQADFGSQLARGEAEHRAGAREILGGHASGGGRHGQNIIDERGPAHPRANLTRGMPRAHPVHHMKTFTIEQANRTLPLVRRIVQDIVDHYAHWQDLMRSLDVLAAGPAPDTASIDRLQRDIQSEARAIDGFVRELKELGVEMKGFDIGLVDFPGEIDGRPVYLCWRLGEDVVAHWHERDAGFAGRRPLAPTATA